MLADQHVEKQHSKLTRISAHKLAGGQIFLIGFATPDVAQQLAATVGEVTVVVQPEPDELATTIAPIPYSRIRFHKQYAAPNQHGFTVTVSPA